MKLSIHFVLVIKLPPLRLHARARVLPTQAAFRVRPGTAVRILEKAKHVTAIEMDLRMAAEVTELVQGKCVSGFPFHLPFHEFTGFIDLSNEN